MDYNKVIDTLTAWGLNNINVRAGADRLRCRQRDASLSDRDIEVYATDPDPLLSDDSWWDQLREVLVVERVANLD
jgi:aminoglycoside 6-adenylyltransferase